MNPCRRLVQVALLMLAAGNAVAKEPDGPRRNLLVELRWVHSQPNRTVQSGTQERSLIVSTTDTATAAMRGSVTTNSQGSEDSRAVQQLIVLNDYSGSVNLSEQIPVEWLDYAVELGAPNSPASSASASAQASGKGTRVSAAARTGSITRTHSFVIRPHWPGGQQPVRVELEANTPDAGTQPTGLQPTSQTQVVSTLQITLGEWLTIARSGAVAQQPEAGTISTQAHLPNAARDLQLRITLAP